ncbi:hypothetical protein H2200_000938 [Cladophialophora chaetospira]|uniref:Uncharacterized protein n=1 Tax=Cladophialophora chaetospira TaxID=386627 RepID=A0AA39CQU5_9EURO|nr:hypothetical protein H2200_000938 [Cladophialophora chaetospira]
MNPLIVQAMASLGLSPPDNAPTNNSSVDTPSLSISPSDKWSELPAEIKANILEYFDGEQETLKVCRLIDKATTAQAARLLFRKIHLWPSTNSLERVSKIADSPTLALHVKVLQCHRHRLKEVSLEEFMKSQSVATRLRSLWRNDASSLADQLYSSYLNEIHSQEQFGGYDGYGHKEFWVTVGKFPNLKTFFYGKDWVYSTWADGQHLLPNGSSLAQRTGVRELEYHYETTGLSLMRILFPPPEIRIRPKAQKITSLELLCKDDEFDYVMVSRCKSLSNVSSLKLIFEIQPIFTPPELLTGPLSTGARTYDRMASWFPCLRELCFGFDRQALHHDDALSTRAIAQKTRTFLAGTFIGITHLTLDSITVGLETLTTFLRRHSSSLKLLTIKNLEFVDTDKSSSSISVSVPKLLQAIRAETDLEDFQLQGTIADITGTRMHCGWAKPGSLTNDVNDYVCHRSDILPPGVVDLTAQEDCARTCHPATKTSSLEQEDSWKIEVPKTPKMLSREQLALLVKAVSMEEELHDLNKSSAVHHLKFRCQKSRNEPTLHPLVGLPLAIATGGLSCAAMGIYRGVTLSRRAKKAQNLGLNQNQMGGLDMSMLEKEQQLENGGYIVPSPVSAVSPTVSELQGASPLERKHSIAVSEMIGSPVEPAPPRYSEVMGTEVGEKM